MGKILKTTFSVINENERQKSIAEEMGKYILINANIKLKVSVDKAWKTFLFFLLNEYSSEIVFLPKTSFTSVTKNIGKVLYFINEISFKNKKIELTYNLGLDEYNVVYIFTGSDSLTKLKIKHIAMIGDYTWSLSSTFGKQDYKRNYKTQINKLKKALEYYLINGKSLNEGKYKEIENTFENYVVEKYKVKELKDKLVRLISKNHLTTKEKKEIKKINQLLKKIGFL